MAFSRICLPVCPRSDRKTAWDINTKLGTHILYSSLSACIDPEVKRSRSHGYENHHGRTDASVGSDHGRYSVFLYARCATCGRCRRASACRYDCLCFLVYLIIIVVNNNSFHGSLHGWCRLLAVTPVTIRRLSFVSSLLRFVW